MPTAKDLIYPFYVINLTWWGKRQQVMLFLNVPRRRFFSRGSLPLLFDNVELRIRSGMACARPLLK